MISESLTRAKAVLSALVNAALAGEDVMICKDGVPVVRLVPIRTVLGEDPCRDIPELAVSAGASALEPLGSGEWGDWIDDPA
ncbi:MAG: type II toxin-antitoxin system prevent-host-death family antitoxin [Candidatus Sericytochromatia bacterium]|nr:type II toxin-antitoxin system prevent-host-death family antitoxin [Candidatus Tanganyikabacteria bacterium]